MLAFILSSLSSPLQAIVKEDELMSRLEMLENQLQVYSQVIANAGLLLVSLVPRGESIFLQPFKDHQRAWQEATSY